MLETIIESLQVGDFIVVKSIVFNIGRKDESQKIYTGIVNYTSDNHIGFTKASVVHNFTTGKQYGGDKIVEHFSIEIKSIHNIAY